MYNVYACLYTDDVCRLYKIFQYNGPIMYMPMLCTFFPLLTKTLKSFCICMFICSRWATVNNIYGRC